MNTTPSERHSLDAPSPPHRGQGAEREGSGRAAVENVRMVSSLNRD